MINFANFSADNTQQGNPGGFLKIVPILGKTFVANWPIESDIINGEITVAPRLPGGWTHAVYELPPNTIDVNSETIGDAGFHTEKHIVEFMAAGFSNSITNELKKYLNAGSVFLALTPDLKWVVAGTSYKPIFMKKNQKFGKRGGEQRGTTLKGEEEGYLWDILPLASTITLNFLQVPAPPENP